MIRFPDIVLRMNLMLSMLDDDTVSSAKVSLEEAVGCVHVNM